MRITRELSQSQCSRSTTERRLRLPKEAVDQRVGLPQRCIHRSCAEAATDVVAAHHCYSRRQPGDDVLGRDRPFADNSDALLPLVLLCCRQADRYSALQYSTGRSATRSQFPSASVCRFAVHTTALVRD